MKNLTILTDLWQKFSAVMTQRLRRPYAEGSHLYRPVCLPYLSSVCLVTILCLTVGFGNAWGTTARISAYGNIVSGQTYWIGATVSNTDYYFKAGGGIATSSSNLSGTSTTTPMTDGTVVLITISSTANNSKTGTVQFTNGNHMFLPATNAKYKSQTSSTSWTFSTNNSKIRMVNNNCALQKNSQSSLNFGSYSAKGQTDVWLEPAYQVVYDANDATGGSIPDTTYYLYNSTVTVSGNSGTLVKTGYTFAGWNTQADGNGTDVTVGSTFSITSNKKLYAKWASAGCSSYSFVFKSIQNLRWHKWHTRHKYQSIYVTVIRITFASCTSVYDSNNP